MSQNVEKVHEVSSVVDVFFLSCDVYCERMGEERGFLVKGDTKVIDTVNPEAYQRAKKRAEAKIGLYIHLAVYIGVNILLIIINLSTSPQYIWFKWPLLGWGIGLFFHGMSIFVFTGKKFRVLREKMIEKEMKRDSS